MDPRPGSNPRRRLPESAVNTEQFADGISPLRLLVFGVRHFGLSVIVLLLVCDSADIVAWFSYNGGGLTGISIIFNHCHTEMDEIDFVVMSVGNEWAPTLY